jgi:hypothetical protein
VDLDPIECPSGQKGLLRNHDCPEQKKNDAGSRGKKKKDPRCRDQGAADDD